VGDTVEVGAVEVGVADAVGLADSFIPGAAFDPVRLGTGFGDSVRFAPEEAVGLEAGFFVGLVTIWL
jgi:hypothetical protein